MGKYIIQILVLGRFKYYARVDNYLSSSYTAEGLKDNATKFSTYHDANTYLNIMKQNRPQLALSII